MNGITETRTGASVAGGARFLASPRAPWLSKTPRLHSSSIAESDNFLSSATFAYPIVATVVLYASFLANSH